MTAVLLLAILAVAGILRFHNLETRQPRISDEADYLMEAQWVSSLGHALSRSLNLYREERRTGENLWNKEEQLAQIRASIRGHAPYLARPGHVLLIALVMQFGMDPMLAGAWESAIFGTLTILLLFLWGKALYGARTALLAAFLLAVSACHVWYSRTALSEADTTFFLLLTLFLYTRATRTGRSSLFLLTGLCAGLGFVVHHRFLIFLMAILGLEALRFVQGRWGSGGGVSRILRGLRGILGDSRAKSIGGRKRSGIQSTRLAPTLEAPDPVRETHPVHAVAQGVAQSLLLRSADGRSFESGQRETGDVAADRPPRIGETTQSAGSGTAQSTIPAPGAKEAGGDPRNARGYSGLPEGSGVLASSPPAARPPQTLALLVGFALPACALELVYHLAFIAFQALGETLPCPTYFTQLGIVLAYIRFDNLIPYAHFFSWENLLTYPYLFWITDGAVYCLLLLAGVFALTVRRGGEDFVVALFFLGPLVFYTLKTANARFACSTLPFASLAIALFLQYTLNLAEKRGKVASRGAMFIVLGILASQAGISCARIQKHDRLEADWRGVMEYLVRTGDPRNVSVYPHLSRLHLGEALTAVPPATAQGWRELHAQGYQHLVLTEFLDYYTDRFDFPEMLVRLPATRNLLDARALTREACRELKPDFEAPCDFCISPLNILEINLNFKKSLAFMKTGPENGYGTIKVYDLQDFPFSAGPPDP